MSYVVYGILLTLAAAHIFIAATASVVILRDRSLGRSQVVGKLCISWLFVYVGPLFVLYLMNDHSAELMPKFVHRGLFHIVLFAPIKPPRHGDRPIGNEGGYYQNADASDLGVGGEGSCGAGGD